jgi:hypothetical protein
MMRIACAASSSIRNHSDLPGARLLEQTLAWALQKLEQTNTLQPILEKLCRQTLSQQEATSCSPPSWSR